MIGLCKRIGKAGSRLIILSLFMFLFPVVIYAAGTPPGDELVTRSATSSLVLKDVMVKQVPVMVSSSEHFILEWTGSVVAGETDRDGAGLAVQSSIPKALALSQNYPNPFNPSTTIAFDIPGTQGEGQHVEVTVYDIRGRRVTTLIGEDLEPGSYRLYWDGRDDRGERVSSGIYLYILRAGDRTFTRKMTVIK